MPCWMCTTTVQIINSKIVVVIMFVFILKVVPNEREGKDELNQDLWRDPSKASEAISSTSRSKRNMETANVTSGE